jgi:glycosyltransferase involved in cell wall biosynthesis
LKGSAGTTPDIICLSTNHWTGLPTSKQHLTWVLSRKARVLYVDPPIDVFSALGRARRWSKLRGLRRVRDGAWVLSPLVLSNSSAPRSRLAFHERFVARVREASRKLGLVRPVLWTFTPEHGPYIGCLDESLAVYHVADDLPAMSVDPEAMAEIEALHAGRVDLIFTVSRALFDKFAHTGKAVRLPNAADVRHYSRVIAGDEDAGRDGFARALASAVRVPPEFAGARRPVLLYGGATYQWFDTELFLELAGRRPDWTFAFVGPTTGRLARGGLPPNVLAVGRRSYEEFPWYVASADVAIMPWRDDEITRNADPIGLYEYLLCGKPVVATPFPAALERGRLVRIARSADEFVSAIEDALAEAGSGDAALERVRFGFENSWEDRARAALEAVASAPSARDAGSRSPGGGGRCEREAS